MHQGHQVALNTLLCSTAGECVQCDRMPRVLDLTLCSGMQLLQQQYDAGRLRVFFNTSDLAHSSLVCFCFAQAVTFIHALTRACAPNHLAYCRSCHGAALMSASRAQSLALHTTM